jgi:LAS superfamily LD-carboxypeptidase LdcB
MRPTTGSGRPYASILRSLAGAVLLLTAVLGSPASAAKSDTQLKQERADVLAKKAKAAAQVNALQADDQQVGRALDALQSNVSSQRRSLLAANDAAQKARVAADAAKDEEAKAREFLASARGGVRTAAVKAYVQNATSPPIVQGNDIDAFARAEAYGAAATGRRTDAIDQLDAARKDLERLSKARQAASANAERRLSLAQQRLISLNASLAEQQGFADAVSARLDAKLAEAQGLATLDKNLSDEITRRETALAAKLAASPPRSGSGGAVTITGNGDIVSVRGIQVHKSIADNLARMLSAADGAGLTLGGGGYRSSDAQVALRRQNCSGNPYTAPASSCHPPTARPGQSMHERGLAIDFTCNGSIINSRSNPCFTWLKGHAGGFGFYNLPSEPWHWSTNGN